MEFNIPIWLDKRRVTLFYIHKGELLIPVRQRRTHIQLV